MVTLEKAATVTWPHVNGQKYPFTVFEHDATWNNVGGVFVFAAQVSETQWRAFYIGHAENFRTDLPSHEHWEAAAEMGATHIHAMVVPHEAARRDIADGLTRKCQPAINRLMWN